MSKTIFILVTVSICIICGNRLMDNRLLRSSPASASFVSPYKSIDEFNVNSFNGKMEEVLKLQSTEKASQAEAGNLPCGIDLDFDRDSTVQHCNDNIVNLLKNPTNYLTNDNSIDDLMHDNNPAKTYPNVLEFDGMFEVEHPAFRKKSKSYKLTKPKLNNLPVASYKDFYDDLVVETAKQELPKRNGNSLASTLGSPPPRGCDCKIRNDLVDLGQQHFPRYLLNAVCHSEHSGNDLGPKCWSGSLCRPLEYKVKVLTFRTLMDNMQKDPTLVWLPDDLRQIWKFKTITVTAGCFCS